MIAFNPACKNIAVVGCGGVASWLIHPLVMLLKQTKEKPTVTLWDGDTIEERNLDRQHFTPDHIGMNKAEAMASIIGESYPSVVVCPDYYTAGTVQPNAGLNLFIGCADNHAARRAILDAVDGGQGWAVIAGNEYTEAEAYYYERLFAGHPVDPRKYYPAILTDNTGDPTRPAGCTGVAQEAAPQLVLANFSAANHALWLVHHHFVERYSQGGQYLREYMPVKTWNFGTKFMTTRACDLAEQPVETKAE